VKTLSTSQSNAAAAGRWNFYRFVKIEWPSPVGTQYYTDRALTIETGNVPAVIVQTWPEFSRELAQSIKPGLVGRSAQFTLRNYETDAPRVEEILDYFATVQGVAVTFYGVFAQDDALASDDWIVLGKYRIRDVQPTTTSMTILMEDWWLQPGDKLVGRLITVGDFANAPDNAYGEMIPWIWGEVRDSPLLLVTKGARSNLSADIDEDDTTIAVDDGSVFTASGSVYIDNEIITYTGVSTNNLTGCTRGTGGTAAAAHSTGALVRQKLTNYRFIAADHACHAITNVRINGIVIANPTITESTLNGQPITYVDIDALPLIAGYEGAAGIADMASLIAWEEGRDNNVASWADAVDADDDAHVSHATLNGKSTAQVLHVAQANDLSGRAGIVQRAYLIVRYQVKGVRSGSSIAWPKAGARIQLIDGQGKLSKDLLPPPAEEVNALLDTLNVNVTNTLAANINDTKGLSLADSKPLFLPAAGSLDQRHTFKLTYQSGYSEDEFDLHPSGTTEYESWRYYKNFSAGDSLGLPPPPGEVVSFRPSVGAASGKSIGGTVAVNKLVTKILDDGTLPTSMNVTKATFRVRVQNWPSAGGSLNVKTSIKIAGSTDTKTTGVGEGDEVEIVHTVTGTWTKAQFLAAEFKIWAEFKFAFNVDFLSQANDNLRFLLLDADVSILDTVALAGANTALTGSLTGSVTGKLTGDVEVDDIEDGTGLVASAPRDQRIDITSRVQAEGGWGYFDGTPEVKVLWPNTGDATDILVYSIGFEVHERAPTATTLLEENVEGLADIAGIEDPYASGVMTAPEKVIKYLLDSSANIDGETRLWNIGLEHVDTAGLTAALAEVTNNGALTWRFDRRLNRVTTCRDLLMQAIRDAGLRVAWDGGRFVFAPSLRLTPASSDTEINRDDTLWARGSNQAPVMKFGSDVTEVANSIGLYFSRNAEGRFNRLVEVSEGFSQLESWGVRRETLDAEWVIDTDTANNLAAHLLADYAWRRTHARLEVPLEFIALELGDPVRVTDEDTRLYGQAGRIVEMSMGESRINLNIAIPDVRTRIWERAAGTTTYIDLFGGGRLVFVIGGVVAARLGMDGTLRLKGNLQINPWGSETTQSATDSPNGEIEWGSNSIRLALPRTSDGAYVVVAELTTTQLRVARLRTDNSMPLSVAASPDMSGNHYQWNATPTALDISMDTLAVHMRLLRTTVGSVTSAQLQIRRIVPNAL